jgi:hypothetical protein
MLLFLSPQDFEANHALLIRQRDLKLVVHTGLFSSLSRMAPNGSSGRPRSGPSTIITEESASKLLISEAATLKYLSTQLDPCPRGFLVQVSLLCHMLRSPTKA